MFKRLLQRKYYFLQTIILDQLTLVRYNKLKGTECYDLHTLFKPFIVTSQSIYSIQSFVIKHYTNISRPTFGLNKTFYQIYGRNIFVEGHKN